MKLLVIGAGGQLGGKIAGQAMSQGHTVYGTYRARKPTGDLAEAIHLDKTSRTDVDHVVGRLKPDWVVDTGALHNVDYCETHPDEAIAVNAEGTKNVAVACGSQNTRLVFVSTDFVFDGIGAPYTEESRPNPLSVYAKSKLDGEAHALAANPGNTCVVRPAVIYSWVSQDPDTHSSSGKPLNFAAWLVSQLALRKEVSIVQDQIASPTLANDLGGAILALLASSKSGLFHTAGATPLSRFEFSMMIAKKMGYDSQLIRPVSSSTLKQIAKRPSNSSLVSERLEREIGYRMKDIVVSLDIFTAEAGRMSLH